MTQLFGVKCEELVRLWDCLLWHNLAIWSLSQFRVQRSPDISKYYEHMSKRKMTRLAHIPVQVKWASHYEKPWITMSLECHGLQQEFRLHNISFICKINQFQTWFKINLSDDWHLRHWLISQGQIYNHYIIVKCTTIFTQFSLKQYRKIEICHLLAN